MAGPTPVTDYLSPTSFSMLPLPHLLDPLDGVEGLDDLTKGIIKANHDTNLTALAGYHANVGKAADNLYKGVKENSLKLDSQFQFYMELYGHVDGVLRDLVRAKLAQLFTLGVRNTVNSRGRQEVHSKGLLDGA